MTTKVNAPARALDTDAARFLAQFGAALAFPGDALQTDDDVAEYLRGERSRLSDIPGTSRLTPAAREVEATDAVTSGGVPVRVYRPAGDEPDELPLAIFIHGGGFVSGSINLNDTTCRLLASEGDMVVVSVGYRLAPECPFPGPLDDCDEGLRWAVSNAGEIGADRERVAIIGGSAGGNLAAALALRARDRDAPPIALQVLIYPMLDSAANAPSYRSDVNGSDYFITAEHMRWYWRQYRGGRTDLDMNPLFSPCAGHLEGLPPAIIITAEFDVLRDEGIDYHHALLRAGVPSRRRHYDGQVHGFMTLLDPIGEAAPAVIELGREIGAALRGEERD